MWTCDTCGGQIEKEEQGWVEWIEYASTNPNHGTARNLRLVHHISEQGCQFNGRHEFEVDGGLVNDLPLTRFLGADGLTQLLVLLDEEHLPKADVIEMTKRLHTPGYEQARRHFRAAIDAGVVEPNMKPGFYFQSQIEATNKWIAEGGDE